MKIVSVKLGKKQRAALLGTGLAMMAMSAIETAHAIDYQVSIKNHRFIPEQIQITAGQRHRLIVTNNDSTPEEFESYELNREKIIAGNSRAVIFIPPLAAGEYPFFGEFNADTARGRIVAK